MVSSNDNIWSQALHELRNSLSVVQMVLERLDDKAKPLTPDRYDRYLQRAQISAANMEQLMAQLFQLESLTQPQAPQKCDRHSIPDLITYVSHQITADPRLNHGNILWLNHCEETAVWQGDREILWQGLQPILHNALQYQLDVSAVVQLVWRRSDREGLTLDIQDHGIGIDPIDRPHLLEPFYRGQVSRQFEPQGFGLGLAIAQAAMVLCRAEIAFYPLIPQGCSCRVTLHPPIG
jgi:signal transduction histidine kinase